MLAVHFSAYLGPWPDPFLATVQCADQGVQEIVFLQGQCGLVEGVGLGISLSLRERSPKRRLLL